MSSDGDIIVVENSMNDNLTESSSVHFSDKNYTYIVDSTSNSGSFTSGQIQFDLSTLNSQSQWINLQEAVIEFPVKITASAGVSATVTTAGINSAIIKNGWHQFIDGCQIIINGQTIQSMQTYENVAAQFRILSSWSQDTLKKWGTSCGFALDDCTNSETSTTLSVTTGLNNVPFGTVCTTARGFDAVNNQAAIFNKGIVARASLTNNDVSTGTTSVQNSILGISGIKNAGNSNVAFVAAGSNTTNTPIYSAFYMATVRLRDLCDINDFPMVKGLKGYVYLSLNTATITNSAGTFSTQIQTGRTCPVLVNTTGASIGVSTSGAFTMTASVDGTATGAIGNSGPLLTSARLLVPYYIANTKTDLALSKSNKFFTSLEKLVTPLTIPRGGSITSTLTSGVPNPRKLLLLPMWQNLASSTWLSNPETSCFDTTPATSGVYGVLSNLQVYLANKPIYQYPLQYSYEQWVNENSQNGLNGAVVNESTSGLLTQQLFEQNHRFYSVDLSRRMQSADGSSQSVQVSFTNPSSTVDMKVIAIIWYEKQWIIDTNTTQLSSV